MTQIEIKFHILLKPTQRFFSTQNISRDNNKIFYNHSFCFIFRDNYTFLFTLSDRLYAVIVEILTFTLMTSVFVLEMRISSQISHYLCSPSFSIFLALFEAHVIPAAIIRVIPNTTLEAVSPSLPLSPFCILYLKYTYVYTYIHGCICRSWLYLENSVWSETQRRRQRRIRRRRRRRLGRLGREAQLASSYTTRIF